MRIDFSAEDLVEALTYTCPKAPAWTEWKCDCAECYEGLVLNDAGQQLAAIFRAESVRVAKQGEEG